MLLVDLYYHQVLSRDQVQQLYFSSVPRCNYRLRQLYDHNFVSRSFAPNSPYGSQAAYTLGKAAAAFVAAEVELPVSEVRKRCRMGTPQFLDHALRTNDFYLSLRAAAEEAGIAIDCWLPELRCRHEYEIRKGAGASWTKVVFSPDGFLRLEHPRRETMTDSANGSSRYASYFVEIDLGHTSSNQFLGKLRSYQQYLESGLFKEIYGDPSFLVLIATTSSKRISNLQKLVSQVETGLFWFATLDEINKRGPFAKVWGSPMDRELRGLIELGCCRIGGEP